MVGTIWASFPRALRGMMGMWDLGFGVFCWDRLVVFLFSWFGWLNQVFYSYFGGYGGFMSV